MPMIAARSAYSSKSCPHSSRTKRATNAFIATFLLVKTVGVTVARFTPVREGRDSFIRAMQLPQYDFAFFWRKVGFSSYLGAGCLPRAAISRQSSNLFSFATELLHSLHVFASHLADARQRGRFQDFLHCRHHRQHVSDPHVVSRQRSRRQFDDRIR